MRVSLLMAGMAFLAASAGGAHADIVLPPDEVAVPVGSCWVTSAYFENSTVTRFCFVSEATATYEGRVSDSPDLLCRGKATVSLEAGRLTIVERDGGCNIAESTWTAETMACNWNADLVGSGGPLGCTVDEPNFGRAKLTLSRD
jgi:hypothetical protein